MNGVIVLTTLGASTDAKPLARLLVEQRLAACVNILPGITSVYRWEDAVAEDGEQLLLIKTSEEQLDALRETLFAHHPYEVPELVVLSIDRMSEGYARWLLAAVAPRD